MAIDLGDSKTGLACCDLNETLAFPVGTITETNQKILIEKLINTISNMQIELVVVGNPINMNGSVGPRSKKCKKFADKLKSRLKIPVKLWDERQSTLLANRLLIEASTKKRKKKKLIDEVAATVILENFLKFRKNLKL